MVQPRVPWPVLSQRLENFARPITGGPSGVIGRWPAQKVPDAASVATIRHVEHVLGRRVGGSTGTNLWGAFQLIAQMRASRLRGSVVTLLCDGGERYANTYYDDEWVAGQGMDLEPHLAALERFRSTGTWGR